MSGSDNLPSVNGLIREAAEDVNRLLTSSTLVVPPDLLDAIRACKDTVIDYLEHNEADAVSISYATHRCQHDRWPDGSSGSRRSQRHSMAKRLYIKRFM